VSIPEVSSRNRLIAFLKKFFVTPDDLEVPHTSGPLSIATTDNIALSASTVSAASNLNTIKTIGKYPLQLHQNQADGYGLYVGRDNGTDPETYPLTWIHEGNAASTEPVLRVDQASEVTATGEGYGTTFELWTPGPNGSNCSLWVDNRGILHMGGDQGASQGSMGTHMVELKTTSYFESETFTGTGLDDLETFSNGYTGLTGAAIAQYRVQIDANGTPDTFKWSIDDGASWVATGVNCSISWTALADNIYVNFGATTGHTIGDYWDVDVRVLHPLRIKNAAGDDIFQVRNDGAIWRSESPSFLAYLSADQTGLTGGGSFDQVLFNAEAYDINDNFASSQFTAPITGKYAFAVSMRIDAIQADATQWVQGAIKNNTTGRSFRIGLADVDSGVDYATVAGTVIMDLQASDVVRVELAVAVDTSNTAHVYGQATLNGAHRSYFSGYYLST